jgi:hypothetical protein
MKSEEIAHEKMKFQGFGSVQVFPAGVELFKQEEPAHVVYFIRDGAVKLVWADKDGGETIVGLRWPGWILGAAAYIAGTTNPASAITLVRSTVDRVTGRSTRSGLRQVHAPVLVALLPCARVGTQVETTHRWKDRVPRKGSFVRESKAKIGGKHEKQNLHNYSSSVFCGLPRATIARARRNEDSPQCANE